MFTPNKSGLAMDRRSRFLTSANPRSPRALTLGNGEGDANVAEAEAWERFREAGLLDESELRRKDREALAQRIQELEKELYDYQYHMGLLLIEKEKWTLENKEIRQKLSEAEEIFKRERMTQLIAMSELEKQQEDTQNALAVEKQRVKDLEEALCKVNTSAQLISDMKLVEAHLTDAKQAEVNQSTEVDMKKPKELQTWEDRLQHECNSSITETEKRTYGKDLACQRDDMQACEQRLLICQQLIGKGQLYLHGIQNRSSESTRLLKEAMEEEENISIRLQNLVSKEKEVDNMQMNLGRKERDLNTREEKLVSRERVKFQKLLDDHSLSLDLKKQEFEMELDKKRESFEQGLKEKLDALEKKKVEINFREDQILIGEDALQGEMNKLKDKEKEIDTKLTLLKVKEESVHKEHQKLKDAEEQLAMETRKLLMSKADLESSRTVVNTEKQQIIIDKENLKSMQLEVKQEIDNCRIMKESLIKETETLNLDKHKVHREMEALDERRTSLATELKQLNHDREAFNDWRCIAEEKLRNESLKIRVNVEQGAEEFRLKKEAFEKEQSDFSRELESRMLALEEMEKKLREKENDIERRKATNQSIIKSPKFVDESNFPKQKTDQDRLVREEKEISTKRIKLETDQFEMFNIDTVRKNIENEQEEFINDRDNFLAVAELCKICKNCGVTVSELDFIGIQTPSRTATERNIFLEEHTSDSPSIRSSCHFPLLRKCSKPTSLDGEASESKTRPDRTNSETGAMDIIVSERLFKDEDEPEAPLGIADTGISNKGGRPNISFNDVKDKRDETASKSLSAKQRGKLPSRRRGKPKVIRKINSDRAGVEDAKGIHEEISQEKGQQTSEREVFADIDEGSQGDSVHGDQMEISVGQKLDFHLASEDEVFSGNLPGGGCENRQTSAPETPNSGEKRYNFRLSTINRRTLN